MVFGLEQPQDTLPTTTFFTAPARSREEVLLFLKDEVLGYRLGLLLQNLPAAPALETLNFCLDQLEVAQLYVDDDSLSNNQLSLVAGVLGALELKDWNNPAALETVMSYIAHQLSLTPTARSHMQ
jgi:hypothetical protein